MSTWRYQSGPGRDLRLDLLRGFCLFVMVIDHLGLVGPDTPLYIFTARGSFFISAAEGFVFISGFTMGLLYVRRIAHSSLDKVIPKIARRVLLLYALAIGMTVFYVALSLFTPLNLIDPCRCQAQFEAAPFKLALEILTLLVARHGANIMVLYCLLVALSPFCFALLLKGRAGRLGLLSATLWLGSFLFPSVVATPFATNFPLLSWQFIFVLGLMLGWRKGQGRVWPTWFNPARQKIYLGGVVLLGVGLLGLFLAVSFDGPARLAEVKFWQSAFDKNWLPPLRMGLVLLYVQFFFLMTDRLWKPLAHSVGWLLLPLGQDALFAYVLHWLVVVAVLNLPGFGHLPYLLYGLAQIGLVYSLILAGRAWRRLRFSFKSLLLVGRPRPGNVPSGLSGQTFLAKLRSEINF